MSLSRPLAAAALLLAACAPTGRVTTVESAGDVARAAAAAAAPVVIVVRSEFRGPLAVYSVSEGVATRLGDVNGAREAEFRLAATQIPANGLTLMAVPREGDARATSRIGRVTPGTTVEFAIGQTLADARASVRSP